MALEPAAAQGSRATVSAAGAPLAATTLRAQIEAAIDAALDTAHRLVLLLDALDGDPDLEPEESEAGAREWCGSWAQRFDVGAAA